MVLSKAAVREVKRDSLIGDNFGKCSYCVFEAYEPHQVTEEPHMLVWLHGADGGGEIGSIHLKNMQRHLARRMFFFVPISPQAAKDGTRFFWGCSYTKSQNKNDLGHVFGQLHEEFLTALCNTIKGVAEDVGASRVLLSGYSMGGFGTWQLAGHMPELFSAIVPVAGYGMGTLEPSAPQPASSKVLERYLDEFAPQIARVPIIIAVHAPSDTISYFGDTKAIVEAVQKNGGQAVLYPVSEKDADSDGRKKKKKSGHHYFNFSLLNDSSEEVVYGRLKKALEALENGESPQLEPLVVADCEPKQQHAKHASVQLAAKNAAEDIGDLDTDVETEEAQQKLSQPRGSVGALVSRKRSLEAESASSEPSAKRSPILPKGSAAQSMHARKYVSIATQVANRAMQVTTTNAVVRNVADHVIRFHGLTEQTLQPNENNIGAWTSSSQTDALSGWDTWDDECQTSAGVHLEQSIQWTGLQEPQQWTHTSAWESWCSGPTIRPTPLASSACAASLTSSVSSGSSNAQWWKQVGCYGRGG
eukprot:TRINITY_DN47182_c0_g1_i1.p1 TRINITY_DN47182_c0_g1~~TRINITY_DN47182_c0_g1_i1.p1  ORF type:complete len:530 (+),score=65.39 TRINITY_DN47182_c0_g1_i1:65-1654(+)